MDHHCGLFRDLVVGRELIDSDKQHKVMELDSFARFLCVFPHYVGVENTSFQMIQEVDDPHEDQCRTQRSWEKHNQYEGPKDTLVISCLSVGHFCMTDQEEYGEYVRSLQNKFEEDNGCKPTTTYVVIDIADGSRFFSFSLGMKDTHLLLLYDKSRADKYRNTIHGCLVLGPESVIDDMKISTVDLNTMKKLVPPEMFDHDTFIEQRFGARNQ